MVTVAVFLLPEMLGDYSLVPPLMERARALVAGAGGRAVWYDGAARRIRFYDPSNPRRSAVLAAGGEYVVVYLGPRYRLRYGGTEPGSALRGILDSAGIPVRESSLEEALGGETDPVPRFEAEQELLILFGETGHPGAIRQLARSAAGRGVRLWAFTDAQDGRTWLVADKGSRCMVSPIALSRPAEGPPPSLYFRTGVR